MFAFMNSFDIPVRTLHKKYREAKTQMRRSRRFLQEFQRSIDPATLAQWETEEAAWLAKVVDMKNHKDLGNPSVPNVDEGRLAHISLCDLTDYTYQLLRCHARSCLSEAHH